MLSAHIDKNLPYKSRFARYHRLVEKFIETRFVEISQVTDVSLPCSEWSINQLLSW